MDRAERRKRTENIINKRKEKIKFFNHTWSIRGNALEEGDICEGQLRNNNEMNKFSHGGTAKKTKTKHSHASYRHKGGYGKAKQYKPHDQKQIDQELDQEEYDN